MREHIVINKFICLVAKVYKPDHQLLEAFCFLLSTQDNTVLCAACFVSKQVLRYVINQTYAITMLADPTLAKIVTFIFVKLILICVVSNVKQPVVETPLGEVSGYFMKTRGGRQISAFTSIPYAVPPVGDLRFKVGNRFVIFSHIYAFKALRFFFFTSFELFSISAV